MTDNTERTETPAKRFGLVMSWLPAPIIFLSTLMASVALVAFIYDGPDDDYLFLSLVALFGGMISLALAAAGYIVSGEFRFFPPLYARRIKQALFLSPIAMIAGLVILVESTQVEDKAKTEGVSVDGTNVVPNLFEEKWYEEEELGSNKFAVTNRVTGAFAVLKNTPEYQVNEGNPDDVAVTVLYRQLIASAYWTLDCEPNKAIAYKVFCRENGKSAYSTFRVEEPRWEHTYSQRSNIDWKFNSSGFVVKEDFTTWPLNEARQKDAYQLSHDIDRPSPRDVKHVMAYFREGSELWDGSKPTTIRFLDENEPDI
jgi:hypothetical protein